MTNSQLTIAPGDLLQRYEAQWQYRRVLIDNGICSIMYMRQDEICCKIVHTLWTHILYNYCIDETKQAEIFSY